MEDKGFCEKHRVPYSYALCTCTWEQVGEEIARLTRERDEAIAVAVWAARRSAFVRELTHCTKLVWYEDMLTPTQVAISCDGTDADIYRALKEASNG